jgi:hypothetical protein
VLGYGGGDGRPQSEPPKGEERKRAPGQQSYDPNGMLRVLGNGPVTAQQMQMPTVEERSELPSRVGVAGTP